MEYFSYMSDILPKITLVGKEVSNGGYKSPKRKLKEYVFYFVEEGEVFVYENNVSYHLKRGDYLLLEADKLQYGTKGSACKFYYFHFTHPDILKNKSSNADLINANQYWRASSSYGPYPDNRVNICKNFSVKSNTELNTLCELSKQIILQYAEKEIGFNVCGESMLSTFFVLLWRTCLNQLSGNDTQKRGENITNAVIKYLNANYYKKLSSEEIEEDLSYSFDYINQVFRKRMNTTVFKTLEAIRIENAKRLLRTTDLPLKLIAVRVGYNDEMYFSKVFKRRTDVTPAKYRKNGE